MPFLCWDWRLADSLLNGQDGEDQSGREAVHVSRFRAQDKGRGDADERHLWPAFQQLIAECQTSSGLWRAGCVKTWKGVAVRCTD